MKLLYLFVLLGHYVNGLGVIKDGIIKDEFNKMLITKGISYNTDLEYRYNYSVFAEEWANNNIDKNKFD